MSYHDSHMKPSAQTFGDRSKKNYYDELNFWIARAKNLETLLIEASKHLEDFEMLMRTLKASGIEGSDFDNEHLEELQKLLRLLNQETERKEEESP